MNYEHINSKDIPILSITIETIDGTVEVPIDQENAFEVRTDGVYVCGKMHFWEGIISVMITNRDIVDCLKRKMRLLVTEDVPHIYQERLLQITEIGD